MFLFKCCQSNISGEGFQVTTINHKNEQVISFVQNLEDLKPQEIRNKNNRILRVQKSQYDDLIDQFKGKSQKWDDPEFQPISKNIGKIDGVTNATWKRISEILTNKPVLFDGKIQPKDVIQGSLGDCYFLSALAALAEQDTRIKAVFGDQVFNPNGIYKVQLRIDGIIQQILVDDYIPVNSLGDPLFCQPNKNEFWVLILQKAWAKAHGGYANIVAGNPTQVFKAVTYAPAEMLIVKEKQQEQEKLWRKILQYAYRDFPCCCGTDDRSDVEWERLNLVPSHAYTLIDARELRSEDGENHRMMKLRNPWGKTEWQGEGGQSDIQFWSKIENTEDKNAFLKNFKIANDGLFFIKFDDFCKYFSQVHFCLVEPNGNYMSEQLYPNKKNGEMFEMLVQYQDQYTFELHQSGIRGQSEKRQEEGLSRGTIVLGRNTGSQIQFVDGVLKFNQEDISLRVRLTPGNYIFYAKLDGTRNQHLLPQKSSMSVYSTCFVSLKAVQQKQYNNFLKKVYLNHGKHNKRQTYNEQKMWIAWKLVFQQGGYAYIAFGNSSQSNKKFVITFDQKDFTDLNFKLKKPFKNKGQKQLLEIMPGTQHIILARVKNVQFKSMKFPPQLGIKLESIH